MKHSEPSYFRADNFSVYGPNFSSFPIFLQRRPALRRNSKFPSLRNEDSAIPALGLPHISKVSHPVTSGLPHSSWFKLKPSNGTTKQYERSPWNGVQQPFFKQFVGNQSSGQVRLGKVVTKKRVKSATPTSRIFLQLCMET